MVFESYSISFYDPLLVLILCPIFFARCIHSVIARFVFPDREAVSLVNSFGKEFKYVDHLNLHAT
jgi:hypothetical protein